LVSHRLFQFLDDGQQASQGSRYSVEDLRERDAPRTAFTDELRAAARPIDVVAQDRGNRADHLPRRRWAAILSRMRSANELYVRIGRTTAARSSTSRPIGVDGVELLESPRRTRRYALVEDLHDPGEVEQRATEAVHLVDHDAVDLPGFDVFEQPLAMRADRRSRLENPPSSYCSSTALPTFVSLARDVGQSRVAATASSELSFEVQPFLGRFPGVDGRSDSWAPQASLLGPSGCSGSRHAPSRV
jgi:hypothetical protein